MGRVLRSAVHPQPQAERDLRRVRPVRLADALPDRLEGGPAIADLRHVPPHDVLDAVIDRAEEPAPAIPPRVEQRRVGPPQLDRPLGRDRAGVGPIPVGSAAPRGRQEPPSRISRSTRAFPTRIPRPRSRIRTFRWPSV